MILDGKALSNQLDVNMKAEVAELKATGLSPKLVVIIVGHDPASQIYVHNKHRKAIKLGIESIIERREADFTEAELLQLIDQYNCDDSVHGILVQLPLPKHIDEGKIIRAIDVHKDVDGFSPESVGKLFNNSHEHYPVSCTPKGIMTMLSHYHIDPKGQHAVIVGDSNIVGRPMGALLLNAGATVTYTHILTENLSAHTKTADILIVATGVAHLIKAADIKPGATVIDVGMDRDENGKLVGDVDYDHAKDVAGAITPVPGGVGPMTITTLMQQTIELAKVADHRTLQPVR
ncbi:bifunctional 5,10-methylene-tetrahydrofolate dehydrogenase 5,10-methylene-tetrahydrofolate cyclohydrolase [Secundilactobacillus odoratitofui DSM 19909 = JCM 15043]|uniref:Bifunctional protein FolD n=1 Tax=Secundilactobacillus odoratitofui DSM 19909 = JCM 15043 TaxID=1423776 RepID=A0A0R1M039_9LACO|nr:tetrahydrofolate dehydrogenase/cyclohydrolase catalytic domain-containing protein [Secundilactobacillus odoratitofui]KRK98074.1 bifunctional 5,10-methylene-tetrahydrofolate dehydrogenase 5,10-methylene-tetrahydrofolate cyclohydrolase [Secundilactobacillus odoratitofui DSM 19909 = JCM 15043]